MPRILNQTDVSNFRARTCKAAAELFAQVGQAKFNMRDLAKRMGVSAMTPYRYFENKEEILTAVRAYGFGLLADRLNHAVLSHQSSSKAQRLAFINGYLSFAVEEQAFYKLMFEESHATPSRREELNQQEQRVRSLLLKQAQSLSGECSVTIDPEQMSELLWSILHGRSSLASIGRAGLLSVEALGDQLVAAIDTFAPVVTSEPRSTTVNGEQIYRTLSS